LLQQAERIEVLSTADLPSVMGALDKTRPLVVIVDSIQTLYSPELSSAPGTVNQIKMCSMAIGEWAKTRGAALFLVGHVTKEGAIAGPKVVEHMVDTVLYFDEAENDVRFVRAAKNRFGSVDEIAIFTMDERGLCEVTDPRVLFLTHRGQDLPPGVVIAPVYEGSRVLLVEIQSLVVPAKGGMPRVYSDRIDSSRVSRVAAVLEKHVGLAFSDRDIYVNVAGGMRITEVAAELPLSVALYSARTGVAVPARVGITGEVSLAGEIREVSRLDRRVKAMLDTGYETVVGPARAGEGNLEGQGPRAAVAGGGYRPIASIREMARVVFGTAVAGETRDAGD
jgi:DNA repair protein RadA/Sms